VGDESLFCVLKDTFRAIINRTLVPKESEVNILKLAIKYYPKFDAKQASIIHELSFHTTKLYNTANYGCREVGYKNYVTVEKEMKSNWHREYLHSHTYQHCLKMLEQNWKSYFNSKKDYEKNPHKYKGEPKPPRYKHAEKHKNEVIFTNLAIRRKGSAILLSLSKKMQELFGVDSLKVEIPKKFPLPKQAKVQQIRIQYVKSENRWLFLIIYKQEVAQKRFSENIMAIDLGLDNLAAITFSHHEDSFLICGKSLKAMNGYIGKEIARFEGIRMKQVGSETFRNTKKISALWKKRHDFMNNYLHQASRWIIKLAEQYDIGKIVIGDMKGVKYQNEAKTFVQVPIQRLTGLVKYKSEALGIKMVTQNESYTSGVSAIDVEPIDKKFYDKNRRFERGLFRSNDEMIINADINGSLNIMRKHMKKGIPRLIKSARDNGFVSNPKRIRVA
jgi:putative transposase